MQDAKSHLRVCVFCGSESGADLRYRQAAETLGQLLALKECTLVYGGGSVGLMGVLADAMLEAGGEVIGVIPKMLAVKELMHSGVKDMRLVDDMHARKALMAQLSDAFIALPGGFGTLEELLEVITWAQLGIHAKTIGVLNVAGYFNLLTQLIAHAVKQRFIKAEYCRLIVVEDDPELLLERMATHEMPPVRKWMGPADI